MSPEWTLAAAESGCDVLWTEDLNDGQLRGVRIRNAFTELSMTPSSGAAAAWQRAS